MIDGCYFTSAIIVAAGSSTRMESKVSKQLIEIDGVPVIAKTVLTFDSCKDIDEIVVVCRGEDMSTIIDKLTGYAIKKDLKFVCGGETRQQSVFNGVNIANPDADFFAIHDGARAFIKSEDISRVVKNALSFNAVALAVNVKDTIKEVNADSLVVSTPERSKLKAVQTPQVFEKNLYMKAMQTALDEEKDYTDDCQLVEAIGTKVKLIDGSYDNIKITTKEDLPKTHSPKINLRVGHGYDVHKFAENRKLILGGVNIESEFGLLGHSDADVLVHSVMDAMLGGAGLRDIGFYFPDTDAKYKNICSMELLKQVSILLKENGYSICNMDITVIAQAPKLSGYIESMKDNIATVCEIAKTQISIKATTEEGLGFTGRKEGISSHCVCLLNRIV